MSQIRMIKADVTLSEMDEVCDDCTVSAPTHTVQVDFRSLGQTTLVGRYCLPCANMVAGRIRKGLPETEEA